MPRALSLCLLLLLSFTPLARALDEEAAKDFKKYFRKYKDTPTRVEAVLALKGDPSDESRAVVDVLVPVLKDPEPEVVNAVVEVLGNLQRHDTRAAVFAHLESQKREALRVGLLRAIAAGGFGGGGEILVTCLTDGSWEVRRRAINALAAADERHAVPAIAPLCTDNEPAVRCAALEGLADFESELVLGAARERLSDKSWQVRSSAILALKTVRHRDSIGPMIARMEVEEGRLKSDLGEALAELTGRNFGARIELWQRFWNNYSERFEIPSDQQLAKMRAAQKSAAEAYSPLEKVTFAGIETPSRSILFVIDVSGSMENFVVEKDRFEGGDYPSFRRIDIVKTELRRTIERLERYVEFNIISFATDIKPWKKKLVRANVLNKSSAYDFIKRLNAIGGASRAGLASAGLTGSANLAAGKTNTYGVLMAALEAAGRGVRDKYYEVAVDTIFFLSDGQPSHGKYVDTDDILREVGAANDLRKVVIHTIAIGEFQKNFMQRLASGNGGVFVDLGR